MNLKLWGDLSSSFLIEHEFIPVVKGSKNKVSTKMHLFKLRWQNNLEMSEAVIFIFTVLYIIILFVKLN